MAGQVALVARQLALVAGQVVGVRWVEGVLGLVLAVEGIQSGLARGRHYWGALYRCFRGVEPGGLVAYLALAKNRSWFISGAGRAIDQPDH